MSNPGQVNILVSTYNGRHLIKEQIDSLLNQTYPNIKIYVRDDGSEKETLDLLEEYAKKEQIILFKEENVGYAKSFMKLLETANDGEYFAFCDQDDIWLKDKITWAVEWLSTQQTPALFCSSYYLTKADGITVTGKVLPPKYPLTFHRSISECFFQGFSCVFNHSLRELMLRYNHREDCPHDLWATCIVMRFGSYKFDERIASNHRRLSNSKSSMSMSSRLKWLNHEIKYGEKDITNCCKQLLYAFQDAYEPDEKAYILAFANRSNRIKRVFQRERYRALLSSEIVFRFLILIGKL